MRLVPYRLPDLIAAGPERGVLILEGEKDVDRAAGMGIIATTNAMGAGKWRSEYNEHFRGRSVCIIPDNDQHGREHAQQVATNLHGIAKNIKVVELPGVPEKGDLSDWLDQGHTKAELGELVKAAAEWRPSPGRPPTNGNGKKGGRNLRPPLPRDEGKRTRCLCLFAGNHPLKRTVSRQV